MMKGLHREGGGDGVGVVMVWGWSECRLAM